MLFKSLKLFLTIFLMVGTVVGAILFDDTLYDLHDVFSSTSNELGEIPQFRAIAISHQGKTIIEQYYNYSISDQNQNLHSMSITKSITSLLVGIAIDKGYINDIDQNLSQYLDEDKFSLTDNFSNLTIRQLLTMQAGFDWQSTDPSEYKSWITSTDQLDYIFNKPFVEKPGEHFNYNDGAIHLLSVIVSEATGLSTVEFANKFLFNPLGISDRMWYVDNRGYNLGNICLVLSVSDMIEIGELVLNNGIYNGKRIISEKWIKESTSSQIDAKGYTPFSSEYGYCWWTGEILDQPYVMAMGYGGQFIFIFKKLNLVVATQSSYFTEMNTSFDNADIIYMSVLLDIVKILSIDS